MLTALALMCALSSGECTSDKNNAKEIAAAIDAAVDDERLRTLLVVYSHHESHWTINPVPYSHDAKDLTSCGFLQMPCYFVQKQPDLSRQAKVWLRWVQHNRHGLPGVDSLRPRALARVAEARRVLDKAKLEDGVASTVGVAEAQPE